LSRSKKEMNEFEIDSEKNIKIGNKSNPGNTFNQNLFSLTLKTLSIKKERLPVSVRKETQHHNIQHNITQHKEI
jgi:hypothetical protein